VELMVVIAIIGMLLAILLPALGSVMGSGRKSACKAEIQQLESALQVYESDYRDFPPSTVAEIGIKNENKINSGNEALVACLSSVSKVTPYFEFAEEKLVNSDDDQSPVPLQQLTGSCFRSKVLWEIADPWDNPYLYFHGRDLVAGSKAWYILNSKTEVTPNLTPTKTGNIIGAGRYQIIACGADGKPQSGDELMSK
jgi:type II secretory pathway pseudopilin PulG